MGFNSAQETQAMAATVYDLLGGGTAVDAAVIVFYRKVLADGRISEFFGDVDMARQIAKQKAFLTIQYGRDDSARGGARERVENARRAGSHPLE
jgi:truncated hemoglobin YjbI